MLVDEMTSSSFVKKNNSYSHCPLKKRPVTVMPPTAEELKPAKTEIKEEAVDVVDETQEPENLSTKPEDLRKTAPKRQRSPSPILRTMAVHCPTIVKRSPSPVPSPKARSISPASHHSAVIQPPMTYQLNYPLYPTKANTPPAATMPIHPAAKRVRVEVLKHDTSNNNNNNSSTANNNNNNNNPAGAPLHFMASPVAPVESPMSAYGPLAYSRAAPIHPTPLLPYAPYCYPEVYSGYHHHMVAYAAHSSPEHHHHHQSVSPSPPHPAAVSSYPSTIQRPLVSRSHHYWPSPEHCGLSPTGSLGSSISSSLRSPPLVTPEDLSSPGSDSGRSSAGSTTVGSCSSIGGASSGNSGVKHEKLSSSSPSSPGSSPRYQCPDCQKSYSTYSGLTKHQQFHCSAAEGQAKKSFSCKNCDKVYYTLGALKMHIRTHTLPCKCDICGKAFSRPWLLQGHIRTHTGEKPFVCQHCNRAFADRSNLRAHLQTHSDVKKYSCSSCSKTFSRMSLLTKHQEGGCPGVAVPVPYGC